MSLIHGSTGGTFKLFLKCLSFLWKFALRDVYCNYFNAWNSLIFSNIQVIIIHICAATGKYVFFIWISDVGTYILIHSTPTHIPKIYKALSYTFISYIHKKCVTYSTGKSTLCVSVCMKKRWELMRQYIPWQVSIRTSTCLKIPRRSNFSRASCDFLITYRMR